jgi:hypothetical protein
LLGGECARRGFTPVSWRNSETIEAPGGFLCSPPLAVRSEAGRQAGPVRAWHACEAVEGSLAHQARPLPQARRCERTLRGTIPDLARARRPPDERASSGRPRHALRSGKVGPLAPRRRSRQCATGGRGGRHPAATAGHVWAPSAVTATVRDGGKAGHTPRHTLTGVTRVLDDTVDPRARRRPPPARARPTQTDPGAEKMRRLCAPRGLERRDDVLAEQMSARGRHSSRADPGGVDAPMETGGARTGRYADGRLGESKFSNSTPARGGTRDLPSRCSLGPSRR